MVTIQARRRARRGVLLLEMIFALAIFVVAATAILLIVRSGVDQARWAIDRQRALDHASSAIARIEAGLSSAQDLAGPVPGYVVDAGSEAAGFEDAPPEPTGWRLEIETNRSEIAGLVSLTVTAVYDPSDGLMGGAMAMMRGGGGGGGSGGDAGALSATLRALVRLDRAEPPDENPDDALQALFDQEALP
ncbi:MAG: type IV pilus modification PilV family protein [Phycisphaerales bacterium]